MLIWILLVNPLLRNYLPCEQFAFFPAVIRKKKKFETSAYKMRKVRFEPINNLQCSSKNTFLGVSPFDIDLKQNSEQICLILSLCDHMGSYCLPHSNFRALRKGSSRHLSADSQGIFFRVLNLQKGHKIFIVLFCDLLISQYPRDFNTTVFLHHLYVQWGEGNLFVSYTGCCDE